MDSYIIFFALVGLSMCLLGLNMIATIITMRAPGLTWSRLPIFVWSVLATSVLMVLVGADADRHAGDGGARPHDQHRLLRRRRRRQPVPVREPVLVLRPPRGLHPRAARLRHRARAAAGVHAQAAVGLSAGGLGDARRQPAELLRVAAPPVRQRHQRRPAAVLHALHGDHLDPDRLHLPVRDGHAVEGAKLVHRADAVLPGLDVQLPDRRPVRRVPLGHAERHRHARQLLRDGALPLHDHGRADLHVLRRDLLLGAEDDRPALQRAPGQMALLADVRRLQLDVHAAVRARHERHAQARVQLRAEPARRSTCGCRSRPSCSASRC